MGQAWLIRHGHSASNAGLATSLPGETPLTSTGQAQADVVAALFVEPPELIIASPYLRARATAEPTRKRFPGVPYEIWPVEEFRCLAPERYRGSTKYDRAPVVAAYWAACDPLHVGGEGTESFVGLMERAHAMLARLAPLSGPVAVFSHGNFLRAALWQTLRGDAFTLNDGEMALFARFREAYPIANCAVIRLETGGSAGTGFFGLETAHLLPGLLTY